MRLFVAARRSKGIQHLTQELRNVLVVGTYCRETASVTLFEPLKCRKGKGKFQLPRSTRSVCYMIPFTEGQWIINSCVTSNFCICQFVSN